MLHTDAFRSCMQIAFGCPVLVIFGVIRDDNDRLSGVRAQFLEKSYKPLARHAAFKGRKLQPSLRTDRADQSQPETISTVLHHRGLSYRRPRRAPMGVGGSRRLLHKV